MPAGARAHARNRLGAIPLALRAERTGAGGGHPYGDAFGGIAGSAYLAGGFGITALTSNDIVVVPIRFGVACGYSLSFGQPYKIPAGDKV